MLGQPMCILIPPVVGLKLTDKLRRGTTATNLDLTMAESGRSAPSGPCWSAKSQAETVRVIRAPAVRVALVPQAFRIPFRDRAMHMTVLGMPAHVIRD
ncbi:MULTISPECIES: hypothetical protein [unclassified Cryobacterium]|uniref:hypothetical protein n=1 Tax=unclassified Cryobacterium TaxID=2649013 RepID=UPI001F53FBAA|nr:MULTISPECIES: hypothetical protein [unclassified Cryobacterium]